MLMKTGSSGRIGSGWGIDRTYRPANGRVLVLMIEDLGMAERVRGDQSACETIRELITQGSWV
jgi:hypothetical protein